MIYGDTKGCFYSTDATNPIDCFLRQANKRDSHGLTKLVLGAIVNEMVKFYIGR